MCLPFLFQIEVSELLTNLQYPSIRSAMFSATVTDGQLIVSNSADPATLNCKHIFLSLSESNDEDEDEEDEFGSIVWMDWMWLKSAMWVGWKNQSQNKSVILYLYLLHICYECEIYLLVLSSAIEFCLREFKKSWQRNLAQVLSQGRISHSLSSYPVHVCVSESFEQTLHPGRVKEAITCNC